MASLLRLAATLATGALALSFVLFAVDQAREGSADRVQALDGAAAVAAAASASERPAPARAEERLREARHGGPREAIDDVNDVLVGPFAGVFELQSVWAERLLTGGLALLLYGLGGMLLAGLRRQRAPAQR